MRLFPFGIILGLVIAALPALALDCTSGCNRAQICGATIAVSGYNYLTENADCDVSFTTGPTLAASDLIWDCQDYELRATSATVAISSAGLSDLTIQNCRFVGGIGELCLDAQSNVTLINTTFSGCSTAIDAAAGVAVDQMADLQVNVAYTNGSVAASVTVVASINNSLQFNGTTNSTGNATLTVMQNRTTAAGTSSVGSYVVNASKDGVSNSTTGVVVNGPTGVTLVLAGSSTGLLSASISPESGSTVTYNSSFSLAVNLSCSGGDCGAANLSWLNLSNSSTDTVFFTDEALERNASTDTCLANLADGIVCNLSWTVNASGAPGSSRLLLLLVHGSHQNRSESVNLSIPNAIPALLYHAANQTADGLVCEAAFADADNATLGVNLSWFNGSTLYSSDNRSVVNATATSLNLTVAEASPGETWICQAFAGDHQNTSTATNESLTVSLYPTHCNLSVTPDSELTSETPLTMDCACSGDQAEQLLLNGADATSSIGESMLLAVGDYSLSCFIESDDRYSAATTSSTIAIGASGSGGSGNGGNRQDVEPAPGNEASGDPVLPDPFFNLPPPVVDPTPQLSPEAPNAEPDADLRRNWLDLVCSGTEAECQTRFEQLQELTERSAIDLDVSYDDESDRTVVRLRVTVPEDLDNVTVYQQVPKCMALYARLINFTLPPDRIIKEDPLVAWQFADLNANDPVQLDFSVAGEIPEDCYRLLEHLIEGRPASAVPFWAGALAVLAIVAITIWGNRDLGDWNERALRSLPRSGKFPKAGRDP